MGAGGQRGALREAAGEAAGARGGRRAAPSGRRRSCHPFSCSGLYKGEGRVREVGGDSLSSSGRESVPGGGKGAGAPGGPEARMGCLGASKSPAAPPPRNLVPGKGELGATKRWAPQHSVCGLVSSPRGWGQGCLQGRWLAGVQARTSRTRHLHHSTGMVVKGSGSADPALVLSSWVTLGKSLPFCAPPSRLKVG